MGEGENTKSNLDTSMRAPFHAIEYLRVQGFKSLADGIDLQVRPLTLLAGANSSGKSSAIQPLLLLKQTLEVSFDPGPLYLNGPNLKVTLPDQILAPDCDRLSVGLAIGNKRAVTTVFEAEPNQEFSVQETRYAIDESLVVLTPGLKREEIREAVTTLFHDPFLLVGIDASNDQRDWVVESLAHETEVVRNRCFLDFQLGKIGLAAGLAEPFQRTIQAVVHVPALRGEPKRAYGRTSVGPLFSGTFEAYTASLIHHWQETRDDRFRSLVEDLRSLGLTSRMRAKRLGSGEFELQVSRLPRMGRVKEYVNISDVGFGVSQVLPVVAALHAASANQLVYIEQPEIHLHPRAQVALADVLARAAQRGVLLVVETHSELLLLGIQIAVANGRVDPSLVKLHWFSRNGEGKTHVDSADLDETGAFGLWPEDFSDVSLSTEKRYLDAASKQLGLASK